ncbi:hypothetical protein SAMN05444277_10584 [Parafilimonas terrae]|uniref:Uncharacterized protein n=1 Tax=Parafilimonas terrae TaxID=1465490 RepID=A0A1I5VN62_9BACT|nr:hypothetical protein SAMN05444277_10584 [Parafilimonas terrae]
MKRFAILYAFIVAEYKKVVIDLKQSPRHCNNATRSAISLAINSTSFLSYPR